nr:F-box protein At5g49610-like [Ipomoea trifida]
MDRREDAKMKFSDPSDFSIFNNVGEGLLVEILARLPSSRAAIQLKLVCKSWCSLISSHYFITVFNHRRHDPSLPPIHPSSSSSACFIYQSVSDRCLWMVRRGYTQHHDAIRSGFHRPDLGFLPCPKSSIRLNASCADLILCSTYSLTFTRFQPLFYYVCNPLTKQWAALPPAPQFQVNFRSDLGISTGFLCVPAPCSLCSTQCIVGDNNNNFMVVRICFVPSSIHSHFNFKAQLFLSEEGEWKSVVVSSPRAVRFRLCSSPTLVPYKGMLHWLISGFVLVYDPYNCPERFCRVIDTPPDIHMPVGEEKRRSQILGLFQNCLRVTDLWGIGLQDPVYYIWELEDYNMGKWSLVHKIRLRTNPRVLRDLLPHLDPKIRDTEFSYIDGSAFYWTHSSSSSGWWVANGIVHWITDQWWPTAVPSLTACTIESTPSIVSAELKSCEVGSECSVIPELDSN